MCPSCSRSFHRVLRTHRRPFARPFPFRAFCETTFSIITAPSLHKMAAQAPAIGIDLGTTYRCGIRVARRAAGRDALMRRLRACSTRAMPYWFRGSQRASWMQYRGVASKSPLRRGDAHLYASVLDAYARAGKESAEPNVATVHPKSASCRLH